ncbi:MAG: lysophospholipid acyltransferase family protein [Candidatus Cloacimonetes bacterium]|nr:lysophospholipid acyltransferase family protein [Candidatus Cloacimonadota bacterium]NLO11078.1 lysophospholipid acyltransferase family protein [Candidatus Cloacimonadota bacterium]
MNKLLLWLEARLGALFIRLYRRLLRWEIVNRNPDDQLCIYFAWHRNILYLTMHRIGSGIAVMVSDSKDGELIAGPFRQLGYNPVRGSTSKNATRALREMIQMAKKHQLAISPDGPRGPVESIQPGVFEIALLAKIPIIAAGVSVKREWCLNSWDGFRIPKPFTKVRVEYSDPFYVTDKSQFPTLEQEIRAFIEAREGIRAPQTKTPGE